MIAGDSDDSRRSSWQRERSRYRREWFVAAGPEPPSDYKINSAHSPSLNFSSRYTSAVAAESARSTRNAQGDHIFRTPMGRRESEKTDDEKAPTAATNWPIMPAPRPWLVSLAAAEVDRWKAPIGGGAPANQRRPRLTSGASRRGNRQRRSPRRAARNVTSSLLILPLICGRYDSARQPKRCRNSEAADWLLKERRFRKNFAVSWKRFNFFSSSLNMVGRK